MSKYKVLWIDDKWKEIDSFIDLCGEPSNDIDVIPYMYSDEGMSAFEEHIEEWSGVILDAKCLINKDAQIDNLKGLTYSIKKIEQLSSRRKVPYYIFTGQPDTASGTAFAEEHSENYYEKDKDEDKLIADIIANADKLRETQIIHKYQKVFDLWPNSRHDLIRILQVYENEDWTNNLILNAIRKIMDDFCIRCYDCGICKVQHKGTNINECSTALGMSFMQKYIPLYVQRSIHSCVAITNSGSHRTVTDVAVAKGNAPYLIRSLVMEMLNILYWSENLPPIADKTKTLNDVLAEEAAYNAKKQQKKQTKP